MSKTIAIIGAGPAGLMAAEMLAQAGHHVTIYDRMPSAGRKFLMAGRGGLNLTHSEDIASFLSRYGAAAGWLTPCVTAFPPQALRSWCEGLGQETFTGSSGRVFPRVMKAAPLLRAWLKRLEALGVAFAPRHHWEGFAGNALRFSTEHNPDLLVTADATLLALGGASWPRLGSDGGWVKVLQAEGIALSPLRPANCGFHVAWSEHFRSRFAGQPLKPVMLSHENISKQGEAMITANGIEGNVVYAMSSALRGSIEQHGTAHLTLDLRPGMQEAALARKLDIPRGNQSLSSYLRRCGLSPLIIGLLRETTSPAELAQASSAFLAVRLKTLPLTLDATSPIARAISTAGGITREALDEHFMLRGKPGIFAAGEMLHWEAPTGGYLLQACFSTAFTAAQGILHYLK